MRESRPRTFGRIVAAALAAALLFLSAPAYASIHDWDGGHDVTGWSEPAGNLYFAEGTTRNGFEEYLILRNPGANAADVTIEYLFGGGSASAQQLVLEPWAGASIRVNDAVGPDRDVSVAIDSSEGLVAERQMYFNYKGVWTGGHASRGVGAPSGTWHFAEGTTRGGFAEWLCLQNPADTDGVAEITYFLGTGENRVQQLALPANSRQTVDVNAVVGPEQDVSVTVESSVPVIAERPMYFDYKSAWRGGHTACGSEDLAGEWYFAEGTTRSGFEEYLCVLNPGPEVPVTVEYMFSGQSSATATYVLRASARTTFFINEAVGPERDVSIRVTCAQDILCERPMYFWYHGALEGGHDVLGSTGGGTEWYFPTTSAGTGAEPWLCVMNPGSEENPVTVEVFGEGGGYHKDDLAMPARSRSTLDLSAASAGLGSPWLKVSAPAEVIVERPCYFSYEPSVEPGAFAIATWGGIDIESPIRYCDLLGPIFHEASSDNACPPMQPVGVCLVDDNPARLAPGISRGVGSDPFFFIEESRDRGTYSTTACDVQARAGTVVYAPVTGLVVTAESYMLYGAYPDLRVRIAIDGHPGYQMAVLHMSQLLVAVGQWAEAGKTPVGVVRDLVPYFYSGPNPYTRDDGNHTHIQINYYAGGGTVAEQP
ncbi:MAG: DUF5719 family protein [Actinomycetota bacterium]